MIQTLPGLIDIHVHLRDPGATQKEDFVTGAKAAAAGGFTFILDMPNNPGVPTITPTRLEDKIRRSRNIPYCRIGFHYGTDGKNLDTFASVMTNPLVYGLKLYLGKTTGDLIIESDEIVDAIFDAWKSDKPILLHATGNRLSHAIARAAMTGRRVHICHIADPADVERLRHAKQNGVRITAGVTPHHLFLNRDSARELGPYGLIKPPLVSGVTRRVLWNSVKDGTIDIIESDHSPHTKEEKESGTPFYGMPQLETTLGLLCAAVHDGEIPLEKIREWLHDNPKRIFSLPDQPETHIEFDPDMSYRIGENGYQTKCGWSPYDGRAVYGKVSKVICEGRTVVDEGVVI